MESPRLKAWRNEYLTDINKFREKKGRIIYLDETWWDSHDESAKGWPKVQKTVSQMSLLVKEKAYHFTLRGRGRLVGKRTPYFRQRYEES